MILSKIKVARGDLGVEIPQESLLMVQKEIVRKTNDAGKPVVVATQMLDSMQKNPRPTRAECTDVSNAVFDGADCVMLSGESAKGKYPVQSVATMKRIVDEAARYINGYDVNVLPGLNKIKRDGRSNIKPIPVNNKESVASSINDIAARLHVAAIVVICESGKMAASLSKFRPAVPVVCFTKNAKQARLLQIHYGLHPTVGGSIHGLPADQRVDAAVARAKDLGLCKAHDKVIVVEGKPKSSDLAAGFRFNVTSVL